MAGASGAGKLKLQPLPKKLSDEKKENQIPAKETAKSKSSTSKGQQIEPRRVALNFRAQTIVLEYKEQATGKLRHRSFRIDLERFETAEECQEKLWGRIKKTVVPGSLQPDQIKRLVLKLFSNVRSHSPDQDEIEAATQQLINAEVAKPEPTPNVGRGTNDNDANLEEAATREHDNSSASATETTPAKTQQESLSSLSGLPSLGRRRDNSLSTLSDLPPLGEVSKPVAVAASRSPIGNNSDKEKDAEERDVEDLLGADEVSDEEIPDYADDFEDIEESPLPGRKEGNHLREDEEGDTEIKITKTLAGDALDLQHVDPEELADYKAQMGVLFEQNAIKPGDPRFQHDVQIEFSEPEEDAGWDEDDDYVPSDDDNF